MRSDLARALSRCVAAISRTAHVVSAETQLVIATSPTSSSCLGDRANRPRACRTGSSLEFSLQPFLRSSERLKIVEAVTHLFLEETHIMAV